MPILFRNIRVYTCFSQRVSMHKEYSGLSLQLQVCVKKKDKYFKTQHMKIYIRYSLPGLALLFLSACNPATLPEKEIARKQIAAAEKEFEQLAGTKGIAEAFAFFADSMAVIKRGNDSLVKGKEGIRKFYSAGYFQQASVKWSPDFIDASEDGKMGYTYGRYQWTSTDSKGVAVSSTGVFHTVWKKQADGSWKYVWD